MKELITFALIICFILITSLGADYIFYPETWKTKDKCCSKTAGVIPTKDTCKEDTVKIIQKPDSLAFFVSYIGKSNTDLHQRYGNFVYGCTEIPKQIDLIRHAEKTNNVTEVIIMSIYQFKNQKSFDSFYCYKPGIQKRLDAQTRNNDERLYPKHNKNSKVYNFDTVSNVIIGYNGIVKRKSNTVHLDTSHSHTYWSGDEPIDINYSSQIFVDSIYTNTHNKGILNAW